PITDVATEIPLCFSISIQSDFVWVSILLDFTAPAVLMAPPKRSSFSVRVVFPASGWAMIAKVLLFCISGARFIVGKFSRGKGKDLYLKCLGIMRISSLSITEETQACITMIGQ